MAEAGGGPISVIARHMQLIRDDFISELFDKMKAEIRGWITTRGWRTCGGRASPRIS